LDWVAITASEEDEDRIKQIKRYATTLGVVAVVFAFMAMSVAAQDNQMMRNRTLSSYQDRR
jgi:hypothetical protein